MTTYPIAPAVYRALRDECDNLCGHCAATADDQMRKDEDGVYWHSNKRECGASALRRLWEVMQVAQDLDGS